MSALTSGSPASSPGNLFPPLDTETRLRLENFYAALETAFPLKAAHRAALPAEIRRLSEFLTSGRSRLPHDYMSSPPLRSAYLYYFLPWNVYRLSRLLPALKPLLGEPDFILDLGSGPLTLPISWYLSYQNPQAMKTAFLCADKNSAAMRAGKTVFDNLPPPPPLRVEFLRSGFFDTRTQPAPLVTAVNVFNEMYQSIPQADRAALSAFAQKSASRLDSLCAEGGSVLVVEPGNPRGGAFISCLREALLSRGFSGAAPCPHNGPCPIPGGRPGSKWCHFSFDTEGAPEALKKISEAARLYKKDVTLSFLLVTKKKPVCAKTGIAEVGRIVSQEFSAPALNRGLRKGGAFYVCTRAGLAVGTALHAQTLRSGSLVTMTPTDKKDPKTGLPAAALQCA